MELQLALQLLESFANAPHGVATMHQSIRGTTDVVGLGDS